MNKGYFIKVNFGLLAIMVMAAALLSAACNSRINPMTMTTDTSHVNLKLWGSETATINWGDGSKPETVELAAEGFTGTRPSETIAMPSQSYVGRWHPVVGGYIDNVDYFEILSIDVDKNEIRFEWFIVNLMVSEGTAKIENNRIKFVTEEFYDTSGTLEFNENGFLLFVEQSDAIQHIVGQTIHYTVRAEEISQKF